MRPSRLVTAAEPAALAAGSLPWGRLVRWRRSCLVLSGVVILSFSGASPAEPPL